MNEYEENKKLVDAKYNIRTVTHNNFITAKGLVKLSLKARKLLYIAISQCRLNDDRFYTYEIGVPEFSELMGIKPTNVYQEADSITDELMSCIIQCKSVKEKSSFKKYSLFSFCEYERNGKITFKLNPDMTEFLLHLTKDFTKPLLNDFLKMKSPYSMAIWNLMQREMKSKKPGTIDTFVFDLSLEELREVTGTESKFKQVGQFKEKVLNKAIREIKDNCAVEITYDNLKQGRTVIGFRFTAVNAIVHYKSDDISPETLAKVQAFKSRQMDKKRELTPEEQKQYNELTNNAYQIELKFVPPKKR